MRFRKIKSITFEDPGQNSIKFGSGEYAIYDGMDIYHINEENMTVRVIRTNGNFVASYSTSWASHPTKDESDFGQMGSVSIISDMNFADNGSVLEKEILDFLSSLEDSSKIQEMSLNSRIEIESVGQNLFDLVFDIKDTSEGPFPYMQLSVKVEDEDNGIHDLGIKLKLDIPTLNSMTKAVRLMKKRLEEGKFHNTKKTLNPSLKKQ